MTVLTEFAGPGADLFDNIEALNCAYLGACHDLKGPQKGRLAASPFLLFSIRESDLAWWKQGLRDDPQRPLLQDLAAPDVYAVQTAAIGVLWQLARDNPYLARLISGACKPWCDLLADLPLIHVLDRVAHRADLIRPRLTDTSDTFRRLLTAGTSSRSVLRRSAQIAALQKLLTKSSAQGYTQLPAAACKMPSATLGVAERHATGARVKKQ